MLKQKQERMKFYFIVITVFLGSCTVTKRVHQPSFHVEWKQNYSSAKSESNSKKSAPIALNMDSVDLRPQETILVKEAHSTHSTGSGTSGSGTKEEIETNTFSINSKQKLTSLPKESLKEIQLKDFQAFQTHKIKDEPIIEKRFFPRQVNKNNSKRNIPLVLAIVLSYIILHLGILLITILIFVMWFVLEGFVIESLLVTGILIFLSFILVYLLLYGVFHLFNREETRYASNRERNKAYSLIILGILLFPLFLVAYSFLRWY